MLLVFDMQDPSRIPPTLEPLFQAGEASVDLTPVMNFEDLQVGPREGWRLGRSPGESAERHLGALDVLDKTREGVDCLPHLCKRQVPSLEAEAPEPSLRRPFGVFGLVLAHEQGDPERVLEVDGRQLGRGSANEIAGVEGSAEVPVRGALDRHGERMFAWSVALAADTRPPARRGRGGGGRLMAARERLTWERDALRSGMDPAEVERRRESQERVHEAAEAAQEAIERERVVVSLLLESSPPSEAEWKAERGEQPLGARLAAFQLEVSRALRTATLAGSEGREN